MYLDLPFCLDLQLIYFDPIKACLDSFLTCLEFLLIWVMAGGHGYRQQVGTSVEQQFLWPINSNNITTPYMVNIDNYKLLDIHNITTL